MDCGEQGDLGCGLHDWGTERACVLGRGLGRAILRARLASVAWLWPCHLMSLRNRDDGITGRACGPLRIGFHAV